MRPVPYEIIMERLSSCILSDVLDGRLRR